jgi:hypothetical protein
MWNNRIVKHERLAAPNHKDGAVWYSVHEVFYNENGGINGYTEDPISIVGETVEDVKSQLKMIMKDIEKHGVIDASTVEFEDWDEAIEIIEDEVKMDKAKLEIRKLHDEG